jgi:hypothetical protein
MKRFILNVFFFACFLWAKFFIWREKLRYPHGAGVMALATPVVLYTTAGMPLGARALIPFYRPLTTADALGNQIANVIPFGNESSGGTQLGGAGNLYTVESLSLDLKGTNVMRNGTYGEDKDKSVVRSSPSLRASVQMATAGTPTICPGDFILIALGMKVGSTGASPSPIANTRWYVPTNGVTMDQNQANKFNVTFELDRDNSSPNLIEF